MGPAMMAAKVVAAAMATLKKASFLYSYAASSMRSFFSDI
jgi:hypothetical protein